MCGSRTRGNHMKTTQIVCGCIAVLLAWPMNASAAESSLTPKPGPAPHINGPKVYGCRPGHPFLYRIPTDRPATDPICRPAVARVSEAGPGHRHPRRHGAAARRVPGCLASREPARHGGADAEDRCRRHAGADAADGLEPLVRPLYARITDPLIRQAADAMVASGMADVGYQYVSIDGCWQNACSQRFAKRRSVARGPAPRRQGQHPAQPVFPRHAGPDRLHPLPRGSRRAFTPRPGRWTAPGSPAATSTRLRTPGSSPTGASTSSSTTGARTAGSPAATRASRPCRSPTG